MTKIISIFLLFLTGCGTTQSPQKLSPAVYYKNDICITYTRDVNKHGQVGTWYRNKVKRKFRLFSRGKTYQEITMCGVGVLPHDEDYDLDIKHSSKLNFFAMNTCHREITTENPDKGLRNKNGLISLNYKPTLEKDKACPLYLAVYNRKGKHGWGTFAFESPNFTLPAKTECNGDEIDFNGVSICQARYGTIQKIIFPEEVLAIKPVNGPAQRKSDCPILNTKDNKTFEYILPRRECFYGFIGKTSLKEHKLYTVGYEEVIVRDL